MVAAQAGGLMLVLAVAGCATAPAGPVASESQPPKSAGPKVLTVATLVPIPGFGPWDIGTTQGGWAAMVGIANVGLIANATTGGQEGRLATRLPSLVTDPELGEQLKDALDDKPGVLMRWHDSTVVGDTIEETFDRANTIELNARLLWGASRIGDVVPVPDTLSFGPGANTRTLNYFANLERPLEEQLHDSNYKPRFAYCHPERSERSLGGRK